jgi:hypothetical protein
MPLFKSAQLQDAKDTIEGFGDEDQVILFDVPQNHEDEDVVELEATPEQDMHNGDAHAHAHEGVKFDLGSLPGCNVEILEVSTDDEPESVSKTPEKKKDIEVRDAWDVNDLRSEQIVPWIQERFSSLPRHNGESLGIERTMSYLKKLDRKLSDLIANDLEGKADIAMVEAARTSIRDGIDKLEDAREKQESGRRKKRAEEKGGEIVKEAQKTTAINGMIITVPLLISTIARTCINSCVSAGKDIERVAHELIEKYNLTDREQLELLQHLADMNFPVRRPRGYKLDEKIDPRSTDNFDWMAHYNN